MADDTSTLTPAAPTTDASPFTPMAEASALGTPPSDGADSNSPVAIPVNGKMATDADTAESPMASPFSPPTGLSTAAANNPIPMPPDLDEAISSVKADPAPVATTNTPVPPPVPTVEPADEDALNAAVAKLEAQKADAQVDDKPPVTPPAPAPEVNTTLPKPDAKPIAPKPEVKKMAAPKQDDNPRLLEHIDKVTAPVDTMIANAQSMDNKELVALLQKQKEALSSKAREDFARNDKLKSERLSKAATVVAEILQVRSAGQKITEQVLYEYDPATAAQAGTAEFPNAEMALETARAVYQLVGAKEPSDLQESEADENGNKVATATRETDIGVLLKEWVSLATDGSIAQMRISTVGEV